VGRSRDDMLLLLINARQGELARFKPPGSEMDPVRCVMVDTSLSSFADRNGSSSAHLGILPRGLVSSLVPAARSIVKGRHETNLCILVVCRTGVRAELRTLPPRYVIESGSVCVWWRQSDGWRTDACLAADGEDWRHPAVAGRVGD